MMVKKIKSKLKRFLVIFLSVIIVCNFITPSIITPVSEAGSFGGYVMYPLACLTGGIAWAFQQVLNLVKYAAEALGAGGSSATWENLFLANIVYNEVDILKINIFDASSTNPLFVQSGGSAGAIKEMVMKWFGVCRIIALSASLVTLMFAAIKMITSSTVGDKAKYKILLTDWLKSLLLIFALQYIMAAIMFAADLLTTFFAGTSNFSYAKIIQHAFKFGEDDNLIWSAVWITLLVCTFAMIVIYLKRLVLVCFFVAISPLIVILHTVEKLRGKKSKIFKKWLDEFIANVAMQPIDALIISIILESITTCVDAEQPAIAIVFALGFFPIRSWMIDFLGQPSSNNKQDKATAAVKGAAAGLVASDSGATKAAQSAVAKMN